MTRQGIQRAERFIEHQDLRAGHQTAGNSHPLGHAAGKLRGQRAGELAELHARQHLQCPLALRRPAELFIRQAEHHVVEHVKPREQARLLKHNAALFAHAGDRLVVLYSPQAILSGSPYSFIDYQRQLPVGALAVVYLVLVVAVAGRKGVLSVLGLLVATGVLAFFMIPALLSGSHPLAVTLVGSMAMMLAAVYVAHGVSIRTTTALLGTVAGIVLTVLLALWGTDAAHLTGDVDETARLLASRTHIDLQTLLTCGMVIAGLGVLNDVTITQASSVWELHAANPLLSRTRLFTGGMRIGRDHIASTVYTLAFAYAGTALPLILAASLMDRAVLDTMLSGEIAEEIVRTLISSIGLVLAIPATTAIAAALCRVTPVLDD